MSQQRRSPTSNDGENAKQFLLSNVSEILQFNNSSIISNLITNTQNYIRDLGGDITTSQLRNLYAEVKKNVKTSTQLQLMRPKLAYVAARQNKPGAKRMVEFISTIIEKVETDEQVPHFTAFFEAIVAYHKFYYGKKG